MLEQNRTALEKSGVLWWHSQGFKGKGVKIAILDNGGLKELQRGYIKNPLNINLPAGHGANCCDVAHIVAPEADIYLLPYNERGADYVQQNDFDIVSISMSDLKFDFHQKLNSKPIVFASAGNYTTQVKYPAAYDWTFAIGAYDAELDRMMAYSTAGEEVTAASYTNIYTLHDSGNIAPFGGTSCATPYAAACVALLLGACKQIGIEPTRADIKQYIIDHSLDILEPGRDNKSGWGVFNMPKRLPRKVVLELNKDTMTVNDSLVTLDVPMQAINNRTMIPLRAVSEALGASVDWDNISKTATIKLI